MFSAQSIQPGPEYGTWCLWKENASTFSSKDWGVIQGPVVPYFTHLKADYRKERICVDSRPYRVPQKRCSTGACLEKLFKNRARGGGHALVLITGQT